MMVILLAKGIQGSHTSIVLLAVAYNAARKQTIVSMKEMNK